MHIQTSMLSKVCSTRLVLLNAHQNGPSIVMDYIDYCIICVVLLLLLLLFIYLLFIYIILMCQEAPIVESCIFNSAKCESFL